MTRHFFLEPIDILYLRGNRLFGGPGDHGEALMPPWPSLAAGALRTQILSEHGGITFDEYRNGKMPQGEAGSVLGLPDNPGTFRVSFFSLAIRENGSIAPVFPLPADITVSERSKDATYTKAVTLNSKILSSYPAFLMPVLPQATPEKPQRGIWLNARGLESYLNGAPFEKRSTIAVSQLWERDPRLGIALSSKTRCAEEGRIYSAEAIAMKRDVGFLVSTVGDNGLLPLAGILRFGGDGRGAVMTECRAKLPQPDWEEITKTRRFKIVLSTPGIFPQGWLIPGTDRATLLWRWRDIKAKLVCLTLYSYETISGWDLVTRRPKPASRALPAGSVYWFDDLDGDVEKLREILDTGLWDQETSQLFNQRRAEGFNNVLVACWPKQ